MDSNGQKPIAINLSIGLGDRGSRPVEMKEKIMNLERNGTPLLQKGEYKGGR